MNTKDFLNNRISEVKIELSKLKTELIFLENTLASYPKSEISTVEITSSVNNKENLKSKIYTGTWIENILTVIKNKDRFLHNSEIAEELYSSYSEKTELEVRRRISAVLSTANSKGNITSLTNFRFSKSIKDTVWGKKEWLNEQGEIKEEYIYTINESQKQTSAFDF